uniref:Protein tyrosine phosphatase receptor type Ja n=1 Tax=Sinocyclocheilus rhinocerous TaxID=307959 RepID=A0A673M4Z8_9TELE
MNGYTETSITLSWLQHDVQQSGYSYLLIFTHPNGTVDQKTVNNARAQLLSLQSASQYNISIITQTAGGTKSYPQFITACSSNCHFHEPTMNMSTELSSKVLILLPPHLFSEPDPVQNLQLGSITTNNISVIWAKVEGVPKYVIRVYSEKVENKLTSTNNSMTIYNLMPSTLYNISVQSSTSDNTEGEAVCLHVHFKNVDTIIKKRFNAAPVESVTCTGPDLTFPMLTLSWSPPPGNNQGFEVKLNSSNSEKTFSLNHTFTGLRFNTLYKVMLWTIGCGKKSTVESITCMTGITSKEKPVVPKITAVSVSELQYNKFTLNLQSDIFNDSNGPVLYYGVLVYSGTIGIDPIKVEDYEAYYRRQRADSFCGFAEEFEDLRPVGINQLKTVAQAPENKAKNRYNNVLPYDSSRVKLSVLSSPFDDYINASYMPGYTSKKEFIAAQGPLPCTVDDFWRLIWEKNVHTIVMLTKCNEQGRVKCEEYWPAETKHFHNLTVTNTSEITLEDWTLRDFEVKNVKTAESRSVRHFHFTAWPDHGVPETTELLINFRHLVREHMDQYSRHSPTLVHCSAGVGRTGTFIAIDRLIFQIERDGVVDVYGIIHDLRMHRPLMVQTEDQYVFLNQCSMDIIKSRTGNNVDLIYQNTAALTIYENFEPLKKAKNGYHKA